MMLALLIALAATDAPSLQRQNRQDTIYTLRGSSEALNDFQKRVKSTWTGGAALDADPSDGVLTYWAYSDRTAAESRALMIPAFLSGLQMGFEEYKEAKQFPSERERLDQAAVKCGMKTDPFFVTPKKSVEITLPPGADFALRSCLADGARPLPVTTPRQGQTAN